MANCFLSDIMREETAQAIHRHIYIFGRQLSDHQDEILPPSAIRSVIIYPKQSLSSQE